MIGVDTNVLVYAHRRDSQFHEPADRRLTELAESGQPWAIPWPCIHEFLAIVTHPRIFQPPSTISQALGQVDCWLEVPSLMLLGELPGYASVFRGVLESSRVTGPRIHDARIAALCLQHGIRTLWSADRDLGRFGAVMVVNPVVAVSTEE